MKNVNAIPAGTKSLTQNELRSLFGLANYYQCFIRDFLKVVKTLSDLLEKMVIPQVGWALSPTFGELKRILSLSPVLKFVEFDKPFDVHIGESDFAVGGVLMQDEWPLHMRAWSSMVVRPCPICWKHGYPKSGRILVTKSLGSSRASSLRKMWSSSRIFTSILRCLRRRGTLPLADVDVRWMVIAYGSMKLDDCQRRRPFPDKEFLT